MISRGTEELIRSLYFKKECDRVREGGCRGSYAVFSPEEHLVKIIVTTGQKKQNTDAHTLPNISIFQPPLHIE